MRICFLITATNVAGGANRSMLDLLPYLLSKGHTCSVIMNGHGTMEEELRSIGVPYAIIPFLSDIRRKGWKTNAAKKLTNIYAGWQIQNYLRKEKIDLFHNNSLPVIVGMEAAGKAGVPYICHIRENVWEGLGSEFYDRDKVRDVITKAGATIVISDYIRRVYEAFAPAARFVQVYDGIQIEDYYEEKPIFTGDEAEAAIIGVVNPHKNQKEAVKAAKLLKKEGRGIRLTVVGSFGKWHESRSYGENLAAYVEREKMDYVTFREPIEDKEELRALRRRCDINLICSKAEGMGRTTIESMLSGCLTIAADAGATPEIIKDGETGLLYRLGDAKDLAAKIRYALDHGEEMQAIAKAGQQYALSAFDPGSYCESILDIYESVLKNGRAENSR